MKKVHILLVEDNEGDILLIEEALEEGKVANQISKVNDGEKAIQFLQKQGEFADEKTPDLIILDINLPRISGHEVLKFIKSSEVYRQIPVIMLTTSSSEKDIMQSYESHANCYITKPVGANEFIKAVTSIEEFWIELVKLPPKTN
jgi:CheY-like chemotaxis protein